jgi:hypothetical protein
MLSAWETAFTRRSGYGAFPLTQTTRLGAFDGVGAIHFGLRRDVAGHCNDLIPPGEDLLRVARSPSNLSDFALRAGSPETFEAGKRRARDVSAR